MNRDITLQEALSALIKLNVVRPSRVGPIRTALNQYARILGCQNAEDCISSVFLKSDKTRSRLIEEKAPKTLGSNAVRNLKNNVAFILRNAIELQILSPVDTELASWKKCYQTKSRPPRNEYVRSQKYVIDPIPKSLEREITDYENWSTRTVNRERPRRLRKRPISFSLHRRTILVVAGYLVKFRGFKPKSLTLMTLVEPNNVINYVEWYIEQQGRYTVGPVGHLGRIIAIATYLQITAHASKQNGLQRCVAELKSFRSSLGIPEKVIDKSKRWLSLNQLEFVGRSIYPLNARRVKELSTGSRAERYYKNDFEKNSHWTFQRYAFQVLQSVLVRLLVRIPMRQRNLREMLWVPSSPEEGKNLYKTNGVWRLRFHGNELKISQVKGEINSYECDFPNDLVELLEEWLYKWRSILIGCQKDSDKGKERLSSEQQFVFLSYAGRPLESNNVTELFETATYKFTGVAVNPHMIRTIWATEYIKATNNFIDAAYMLGDTVETVLKNYAKLLGKDCGERARLWIAHRLQTETSNTNNEEGQSTLPPLRYSRSA